MSSKPKDATNLEKGIAAPERVIRSEELFADAREVGILHGGALYRLSMTRQGKLILTK